MPYIFHGNVSLSHLSLFANTLLTGNGVGAFCWHSIVSGLFLALLDEIAS